MRIDDSVMVSVGTRLEAELLDIAKQSADDAASAASGGIDNLVRQNGAAIVAVLCATSALEAFINQEGYDRDRSWWSSNERLGLDEKWEQLLERRLETSLTADVVGSNRSSRSTTPGT